MATLGFELPITDSGYPCQLAEIDSAPTLLYGIGDATALRPGLAVIGARRATPYGLAAAAAFAGWAAEAGYVVYSGAAVGCDQAAHRAALDRGGTTVAVLGTGADVAYPRGCRPLLDEIVDRGGAIVSEQVWGFEPRKYAFRTRNRIIAGLCRVLLVVEARMPSGTFSTVEYALDASRVVAAVPGSIYAPECRGPNKLIGDGAPMITEIDDLARLLLSELGPPAQLPADGGFMAVDAEDDLLRALLADPMRPDDAARALELDIVTTVRRIGALETSGHIRRYPDGRYGPC